MNHIPNRRDFLAACAAGSLGLAPALARAAELNGGHPLAPLRTFYEVTHSG